MIELWAKMTNRPILQIPKLPREPMHSVDLLIQTIFPQQPVNPLRKSLAGVMSSTWIDPDTISLPSVSALGGGLSTEEEWDQVRSCVIQSHSHPGKLKSLA